MGRALLILAVLAVAGCPEVDLTGRPCTDDGACLAGFTCDTLLNLCITTGDACEPEAAILPCEPGELTCTGTCRVCRDGAWSECTTPDAPVAPLLTGVVDLCEGDVATVSWDTVANVDYELQFTTDGSTWTDVTPDAEGTATRAGLPPGVDYQWQIRASNAIDVSTWRESPVFQVTAIPTNPLLSLVEGLCVGVPATLSWDDRPNEIYTVQFWNGSTWLEPDSQSIDSASTTPPGEGSGYKWRLATSVRECTADWTETSGTFTVRPPKTLTQIRVTTDTDPVVNGGWTLSGGCSSNVLLQRDLVPPINITDGDSVTASETGFSDTSVAPAVVYYYRAFVKPAGAPTVPGPLMCARVPNRSIHPVHVNLDAIDVTDGAATEPAWSASASWGYAPSQLYGEGEGEDDRIDTSLRFAWDDDALYFWVSIDDKFLYVDSPDIRMDDSIELFFDIGFERSPSPDTNDFHFVLAADDTLVTERGNGVGWDTTTADFNRTVVATGTITDNSDTDTAWSVEGRIPFSMLGSPSMTPPPTIGFAFWVNEDDKVSHDVQHAYKWMTNSLGDNPSTWGICQF